MVTQKSDPLFKKSSEEFSKLVKIAKDYGIDSKNKLSDYKKILSLPNNQYYSVISAADALSLFGENSIGKKIYQRNFISFYSSRKVEDN